MSTTLIEKSQVPNQNGLASTGTDLSATILLDTRDIREMSFENGVKVNVVTFNKGRVVLDCDNMSPLYFTVKGTLTGREIERKAYSVSENFLTVELGMDANQTGLGFKAAIKLNAEGKVSGIIYVLKTDSAEIKTHDGFYKQVELEDVRRLANRFMNLTQEQFKTLV